MLREVEGCSYCWPIPTPSHCHRMQTCQNYHDCDSYYDDSPPHVAFGPRQVAFEVTSLLVSRSQLPNCKMLLISSLIIVKLIAFVTVLLVKFGEKYPTNSRVHQSVSIKSCRGFIIIDGSAAIAKTADSRHIPLHNSLVY